MSLHTVGQTITPRQLITILEQPIAVPDPHHFIHLQFRRFAGCPVCNLHLRSFVQRASDIANANIREVVVFHSSKADLLLYASDLPFDMIADPEKTLYQEFGVGQNIRSILSPQAWVPILNAVWHSLIELLQHQKPMPPLNPEGGRYGLPADFLIAPGGRLIAYQYGKHASDHWSVDELLKQVNLDRP